MDRVKVEVLMKEIVSLSRQFAIILLLLVW